MPKRLLKFMRRQTFANTAQVREYWRAEWEPYTKAAHYLNHTNRVTSEAFGRWGRLSGDQLVLDLGCGTGRGLFGLKRLFPDLRLVGLDLTLPALMFSKSRLKEFGYSVMLCAGDGCRLPFRDGVFDAVVSTRVLQYVPCPDRAVAEMRRVAKKGGRVVVCVPNKLNPVRLVTYGRRLFSPREVKDWFTKAGFKDIRTSSISFVPGGRFRFGWDSWVVKIERLSRIPWVKYLGGNALVTGEA